MTEQTTPREVEQLDAKRAMIPQSTDRGRWLAYVAAGWAFIFAAMSCYWALAVMLGADQFPGVLAAARSTGRVFEEQARARDPQLIALLWVTGALKVVAGLIALAVVRAWDRRIPRGLRLVAAWLVGGFVTLYAVANLIDHALMAAGVRHTPEGLGSTALRWHLVFWDPWWLLGGLLFLGAAWNARRTV